MRVRSVIGRTVVKCLALACAVAGGTVRADQNVSLGWNASTDTNVTGYYLYFGTNSSNYSTRLDVGQTTTATVAGLTGRSTKYYFAASSYSASRMESPLSAQAMFTTSSNYGPTLGSLPSTTGNVNSLLVVTNAVNDPDGPSHKLSYALSAGSPSNMRVDTNSGRLYWRPQMTDGGTTNQVNVVVTDVTTGLYDTQSFNVIVSNAVQVTLSNVVVALGNTGIMPVTVAVSSPTKSVSFTLDAPSNRVSGVTVTSLIPSVATVTQQPVGAAHSVVTITTVSGQSLQGIQQVAQVSFTATANLSSAFSASSVSSVAATLATGQAVPKCFGVNSQLVLVGNEPLAQAGTQTNGAPSMVLYGPAGNTFQIQSSANPLSTNGWSALLTSGTLGTNLTQVFTNIPTSATPKYYRILKL